MSIKTYAFLTSACLFFASSAAVAQPYSEKFQDIYDRLKVRGLVNFQYIKEDNDDLGMQNQDAEQSFATQARLMLNYQFTDTLDGYLDIRGYKISVGPHYL